MTQNFAQIATYPCTGLWLILMKKGAYSVIGNFAKSQRADIYYWLPRHNFNIVPNIR